MDVQAQQRAVMLSAVVAVVGTIVWLVLVAIGFSAFAKARKPMAGTSEPPLPVSKLAVTAAAVSLGSAFTGPLVVLGQIVGAVLAVIALRDANEPSRTLARWVLIWTAAMLAMVAIVAAITLSAYFLSYAQRTPVVPTTTPAFHPLKSAASPVANEPPRAVPDDTHSATLPARSCSPSGDTPPGRVPTVSGLRAPRAQGPSTRPNAAR